MSKKTVIHIEDDGIRGGTYLQGEPNDLLMAFIGILQSSEFVRILMEKALFMVKVAKKQGLQITKDNKIDLGDEAEEAFKKFVDPEYKKP